MRRSFYYSMPKAPPIVDKWFGPDLELPIEFWPRDRIRAYQTEAVAEMLRHAYENSPFYRAKFDAKGVTPGDFKSLDDLAKFPFVEKDELRGDPWKLLAVPKKDLILAHTSTGTTGGDHSYICYTWEDLYISELAPPIPILVHVKEKDIVINALPYEMSSSGQAFQRSFQHGAGAMVVPCGKGGFYSDPHKTVKVIKEMEATVLITTPPYAMYLSELAEEAGYKIGEDIRLRFMWLTGEGCSNAYRRRLEAIWKCPGLLYYGSLEGGPIGIECSRQNGYHLTEGHTLVEVVNAKTGEPVDAGTVGEVVATNLLRRGSPLIRYRVQDLAYLDDTNCPCSIMSPRLIMRGREVDQIRLGRKSYSPYYIEEQLYLVPEVGHNYQMWVGEDHIVVEVELEKGVRPSEDLADAIAGRLQFYTGAPAKVEFVDLIPRTGGKTRRVRPLSERPKGR